MDLGTAFSLGLGQIVMGIAVIRGRKAINTASPDDAKKPALAQGTTWAGIGLILTGLATIIAGFTGGEAEAVISG